MALIDPQTIKNPIHRKLIEFYGKRMASTPLRTQFHTTPDLMDSELEAMQPKYDLTKYIYPELVYRYYFDSNFTCLIHGPRSEYKSTAALQLALWCFEIAGIPEPKDYDFIVDRDKSLIDWYMKKEHPVFDTIIKDEWDKKRSGIGVSTMSETLDNIVNRVRGRRLNLIICCPEFSPYAVDFYFKTWEYVRYGKRCITLLVFNDEAQLKGHCVLPMPTDIQLSKYAIRKKEFLHRTENMTFTLDEDLINCAEETIKDPILPQGTGSKEARLVYLGQKYPGILQNETIKRRLESMIKFMQDQGLTKFPQTEFKDKEY